MKRRKLLPKTSADYCFNKNMNLAIFGKDSSQVIKRYVNIINRIPREKLVKFC